MKKVAMISSVGCILLLAGCSTLNKTSINKEIGQPTQVVVTLNGIESEDGSLLVYLHDNEYSYYSDDDINTDGITFYKKLNIPANTPTKQVTFDNIPTGRYAITAYHDEDNDGRLDRMIAPFIGMPSESYGSSNDSFSYLSKGSFEDALIDINLPMANITINMSTHLTKIATN